MGGATLIGKKGGAIMMGRKGKVGWIGFHFFLLKYFFNLLNCFSQN